MSNPGNPNQTNPYQTNPYQASPASQPPNLSQAPINRENRHWITQLFIFSIISIVVGVCEVLLGGLYLISGAIVFGSAPIDPSMGPENVQQFKTMMPIIFGVLGVPPVIGGALRIIGAILSLLYKSYGIAFATIFIAIISSTGVYCIPTSVILLIYGLVIYLQPPVKHVFKLAKSGMTKAQIAQMVEQAAQ